MGWFRGWDKPAFYFNLRTGEVEELTRKSRSAEVLGPYATRAEAESALASARARTEAWDEQDRRDRDED